MSSQLLVPAEEPAGRPRGRAAPGRILRSNLGAVGIILLAVVLQVAAAITLKILADSRAQLSSWTIAVVIAAVLCINLMRLGVWGAAHRRYPLSSTFPLSSLFYPAMLGIAAAFGEAVGVRQILGAILITLGSVWLSTRVGS